MPTDAKQTPILKLMHLVACAILLLWAFLFWMRNTPAREAWRAADASARAKMLRRGQKVEAWSTLGPAMDAVWPLAWPDLLLGTGMLLVFVLGTRASVVRISYWLAARGSGEMANLRGIGLEQQSLDDNKGRKGGLQ